VKQQATPPLAMADFQPDHMARLVVVASRLSVFLSPASFELYVMYRTERFGGQYHTTVGTHQLFPLALLTVLSIPLLG